MNSKEIERNNWVKQIRPEIPTIDFNKTMTPKEAFQNNTLRPILKCQDRLIHQIFMHQSGLKNLDVLSEADQRHRILKILEKNIELRNQLIGTVLGLMSVNELQLFYKDHSELKRRIKTMIVERLIVIK